MDHMRTIKTHDHFTHNQSPQGQFPHVRSRRLRQSRWMREMVQENWLSPRDLIWPVYVRENNMDPIIPSLPGVLRHTLAELPALAEKACALGISALVLFPCVPSEKKSPDGDEAFNTDNLICRAFRALSGFRTDIGLIADVALDPYTTHGHDGVLRHDLLMGAQVDNDRTIALLQKQAVILAQAGVPIIAPSDMMDGRVGSIRKGLDMAGFQDVSIMTYGAKYASNFYAPFREAVGSTLVGIDKLTYQLPCGNKDEALRDVALDIAEGADALIVKPGLPYLDILSALKEQFKMPTFAWHVSGEYAMLRAAAEKGWIDFEPCLMESLLCFKRAGATGIFTYGAPIAAQILKNRS